MPFDNTNSGVLFRNKDKNETKHPDYKGNMETKCSHCGKTSEFWLSAWLKVAGEKSKIAGQSLLSIAAEWKDETKYQDTKTQESKTDIKFEDIPF